MWNPWNTWSVNLTINNSGGANDIFFNFYGGQQNYIQALYLGISWSYWAFLFYKYIAWNYEWLKIGTTIWTPWWYWMNLENNWGILTLIINQWVDLKNNNSWKLPWSWSWYITRYYIDTL